MSTAARLWQDNPPVVYQTIDGWGGYADHIAFRNPSGDVVLVTQNSTDVPLTPVIRIGGRTISPTLAPYSGNTFTLAAHLRAR